MPDARHDIPSLVELARAAYPDAPMPRRLLLHHRPRICPFHAMLPHVPIGARVLDVGCGAGLLLALLARTRDLGPSVGFDADARMIAIARAMAARSPGAEHLRFEHAAVEEPWPDVRDADVVCLVDVMHHVPVAHQRGLLDDLLERVRPGGRLLYKDIGPHPIFRGAGNRLHDLVVARQWVHELPIAVVDDWAEARGLTPLVASRMNMIWYGHDLRVFEKPA